MCAPALCAQLIGCCSSSALSSRCAASDESPMKLTQAQVQKIAQEVSARCRSSRSSLALERTVSATGSEATARAAYMSRALLSSFAWRVCLLLHAHARSACSANSDGPSAGLEKRIACAFASCTNPLFDGAARAVATQLSSRSSQEVQAHAVRVSQREALLARRCLVRTPHRPACTGALVQGGGGGERCAPALS